MHAFSFSGYVQDWSVGLADSMDAMAFGLRHMESTVATNATAIRMRLELAWNHGMTDVMVRVPP